MDPATKPLTLSPREAAAYLGIGKTKLLALVRAGRIELASSMVGSE